MKFSSKQSKKKAIAYLRVGSKRQANRKQNEKLISDFSSLAAARYEFADFEIVFDDSSPSNQTSRHFDELIHKLDKSEIRALVIRDFSQLGRSLKRLNRVIGICQKRRISIISIDDQIVLRPFKLISSVGDLLKGCNRNWR